MIKKKYWDKDWQVTGKYDGTKDNLHYNASCDIQKSSLDLPRMIMMQKAKIFTKNTASTFNTSRQRHAQAHARSKDFIYKHPWRSNKITFSVKTSKRCDAHFISYFKLNFKPQIVYKFFLQFQNWDVTHMLLLFYLSKSSLHAVQNLLPKLRGIVEHMWLFYC